MVRIIDLERETALYSEVQHFRQPLLWALIAFITFLSWWGAVEQLVLGRPFGSNPASDELMLIILVVFGIIFPAFFFMLHLSVRVTADGICYRYFPLHLKYRHIAKASILSATARKYRPVFEYGGWGIRYGKPGLAYTVGGNEGIFFEQTKGNVIMIGTRRPAEFIEALSSIGVTTCKEGM
jgi:hypothetical protein